MDIRNRITSDPFHNEYVRTGGDNTDKIAQQLKINYYENCVIYNSYVLWVCNYECSGLETN